MNTINHRSTLFGHHLEKVVDHARFRAALVDFQIKHGVHIHRHRFDLSAPSGPSSLKNGLTAALLRPSPINNTRRLSASSTTLA